MKKTVLLVLVGKRKETAVKLQQVLTAWGCLIKTRLGLHAGVMENCSEAGFLFLELYGSDEDNAELARKIAIIPGIESKLVVLEQEED
ncbi:MAG: hypothetical protein DRP93_01650 [Candidatus Neomarinimicrobiota bacterium]|nr:MAG: hypothetical protein DRP93_01650 [Candidatus Neomarinimicrobiota bacterium]